MFLNLVVTDIQLPFQTGQCEEHTKKMAKQLSH